MHGSFNATLDMVMGQQQQNQQNQHSQQQQPRQCLGTSGNLSGQDDQQQSSSHTLPPLQSQQNGGQFESLSFAHPGSNKHMSTTPHTPSSMSQSATSAYSTMSPVHQGNMLPPSSYNQPYGMTQSMSYPSAIATSIPGTLAQHGPLSLQPMTPGDFSGPMPGFPSMMCTGQLGQQADFMQDSDAPTHVLGSQGRRGVLPSAPDSPEVPAQGTTNPWSMIPQKYTDGRYPCPRCNKTYLHAKHLKRHLFRHTGDKPYICHLCKDTFSRSDVLKRHFQKCSIRRGNPTGANHLEHQRRDENRANCLSVSQQDGSTGLTGLAEVARPNAAYPAMVTSSPTVSGDISERPRMPTSCPRVGALEILASNTPSRDQMVTTAGYAPGFLAYTEQQAAKGAQIQSSYAFNQQQMYANGYNNPQQMSFSGPKSSRFNNNHANLPYQQSPNGDSNGRFQADWHRMFNPGGQNGYIGGQPANASSQGITHIMVEDDAKPQISNMISNMNLDMGEEAFLGSLYSHPGAFGSEYGVHEEHGIPGSLS
ncbi:hypothetical protein LTR17_026754 [Elasticomyces elasticus]|nr:hypothetical protein LTR17_026754 [Elasticomyces elasticus]